MAVSAYLKMYTCTSRTLQMILIQSFCPSLNVACLFSRLGPKKSYTQMKMTNTHALVVYIMY